MCSLRSNITTAPPRAASIGPEDRARALRSLLLPTLLTLVALGVLVSLGSWQVRRLAWKEDLIAEAHSRPLQPVRDLPPAADWPSLDVSAAEYHRYRASGRFLPEKEALVFTSLPDPRGPQGGPGFWVVTPFQLAAGGIVLVNRGFVPQGRHAPGERDASLAAGLSTLTGLLRPDERRGPFTPADDPAENTFYARSIAAIATAKALPEPVAPFTLDLVGEETPAGGLPQAGETRMQFPNNHLQYALTWYGLAVALLAVFVAYARTRFRFGDKKHA